MAVPSTKKVTLKKVHHTHMHTTYMMYFLHRDSAIPFQSPNHDDDDDDDDDENRDDIMRSKEQNHPIVTEFTCKKQRNSDQIGQH